WGRRGREGRRWRRLLASARCRAGGDECQRRQRKEERKPFQALVSRGARRHSSFSSCTVIVREAPSPTAEARTISPQRTNKRAGADTLAMRLEIDTRPGRLFLRAVRLNDDRGQLYTR